MVPLCVEYFTLGHPPVFPTMSPTLLGIGWGIIATWWVGLLLGIPLALAARAGGRPKREVRSLVRPVLTLLAAMAGSPCSPDWPVWCWVVAATCTSWSRWRRECRKIVTLGFWPICGRTQRATSWALSVGSWSSCRCGGRDAA